LGETTPSHTPTDTLPCHSRQTHPADTIFPNVELAAFMASQSPGSIAMLYADFCGTVVMTL
jgi:hypothetical protein